MTCSVRRILLVLLLALLHAPGSARALDVVLENGWTDAPFSTSPAEVFSDNGMVNFKGAVTGGSSAVLFTLPTGMRPTVNVYVSVDLCDAAQGRLWIQPDGSVSVQSPDGDLVDARCFTSLDGVKFDTFLASVEFDPLALEGIWTGGPYGTREPGVALIDGIVHLRGALAGGSGSLLFTLPPGRRPATDVYVPVNLCDGAKGRLRILPGGDVFVTATSGTFTQAQCFTSLDGVSFAPSDVGFTPLSLSSGWSGAPYGTSAAAVSNRDGIIRFKGGITGSPGDLVFSLPAELRPAARAYVPVDLCGGIKGRLVLESTGEVRVQSVGAIADAQCFTSLDGASFVAPPPGEFMPLALENGWVNGFFGTQTTSVVLYDEIVQFKGAVTGGATARILTLPVALRPVRDVAIAVDLCGAAPGRLYVQASTGHVTVSEPGGGFGTASCFVSLEGASFARTGEGFTDLTLSNGWQTPVFQADRAGVKLINGIVHFRGGIANGTLPQAFSLPHGMRPATDVYLSFGSSGGEKGRLLIQPNGVVSVNPPPMSLVQAQDFTSLDGVKFAPTSTGFTGLPLTNGWFGSPFGTSAPAGTIHGQIVFLKGAIAGGVNPPALTLPVPLRPDGAAYVPIDLCNGAKGRLVVLASGTVSVESDSTFSDAQCFTSLDGASFAVPEPVALPALMAGFALLVGLARRTP